MGWTVMALVALAVCAAPIWLWGPALRRYFLRLDDFVYIARSRTVRSLGSHLVTPHNGHVVPLFLVETHLLTRLAGSLEALPAVLGAASYVTLVLAMAMAGHVVAWETGRPAWGLAAMIGVGWSSVLGPAVLWYAAGQALAAGTAILAMLAALQAWRARGRWWRLAGALLTAAAAPLFWSAGYTAGLAGSAYLWADGRRRSRWAAVLPSAATLTTALVVWAAAGRSIAATPHLAERSPPALALARLVPALTHTAQAVCEALVLNNLGLEAATTGRQGLVLAALLAGIWARSRLRADPGDGRTRFRASPLEAAGAVLIVANFAMVFAVRGIETSFENLRALGWYDAVPQLGVVLLIAGWSSGWEPGSDPPPRALEAPRIRELLAIGLLATAVLSLQAPRADRMVFQYDGAAGPIAPIDGAVPERSPTAAAWAERAVSQRRTLARLDRLEREARHADSARLEALRQAVDRTSISGMPEGLPDLRTQDLLDWPGNEADPAR